MTLTAEALDDAMFDLPGEQKLVKRKTAAYSMPVVPASMRHLCILLSAVVGSTGCCRKEPIEPPPNKPISAAVGDARVWAIDDGERIARNAGVLSFMQGEGNPVWSPGSPIRLIGLPGETVAFQVVVTAGASALEGVQVDLAALQGRRPLDGIERFVVHELAMSRRSGGKVQGESLGWAVGAMPPDPSYNHTLPDPLLPVDVAPPWADYPMHAAPGEHRVVWIDITLPSVDVAAGTYRGTVQVKCSAGPLGSLPVELEVGARTLPYAAARTMVFSEPVDELTARTGSDKAPRHYFQLMHRHHLSTIFPIDTVADVRANSDALSGALYTPTQGYEGAGMRLGADVVAIGAYGSLDEPTPERLKEVDAILEELARLGIRDTPGERDVFLYAVDEQCDSPMGPAWRKALAASSSERLRGLRVGHTCSESPAAQPVNLVMVAASAYDPSLIAAARDKGKRVWIYNGALPQTGSFLSDGWHASLRANPWIQVRYGIERWFYWESTFWNDGNRGGKGPYDPLAVAETFHNQDNDHCNGDGVLVYPGTQTRGFRSAGFPGVFPSIRLKQWRRGIQDAGYVRLASGVDAAGARAVVERVVPVALHEATAGSKPPWPTDGASYFRARRELFALIAKGP